MAKKQTTAVAKQGTAPAIVDENIPEGLADEAVGLEGAGYSHRAEDRLIPILGLIQENSGEVKRNHDKFVEDVEAGMLVIRALGRFWAGDGTLIVQPCAFRQVWVEWQGEPGEGVPVAQYPYNDLPATAVFQDDPQGGVRKICINSVNNNRIVDTRYHFVNLLEPNGILPAVIPFAGTGHTFSKQWTLQMDQVKIPSRDDGEPRDAPSWFTMYGLHSMYRQRGAQSWLNIQPRALGWVTDKWVRDAGEKLWRAVEADEVRAADPDVDASSSEDAPI